MFWRRRRFLIEAGRDMYMADLIGYLEEFIGFRRNRAAATRWALDVIKRMEHR
jgi:hypothetical protein